MAFNKNEWQKNYRKLNNNSETKKYEKTKKGFLMRLYRNMQSRVTGVQKLKKHLYEGKTLLPRNDFYEWALLNESFHTLFNDWENSQYERRLTPSVDRIDSSLGYDLGNIEFVPFHENCRRGLYSKLEKLKQT
jgi:4-alpha-glucanotransferase